MQAFSLATKSVFLIVDFEQQSVTGRVADGNKGAYSFETYNVTGTTVTFTPVTNVYCSMPVPRARPRGRNLTSTGFHHRHLAQHDHDHDHGHHHHHHHASPAGPAGGAAHPPRQRQLQAVPAGPFLIWLDANPNAPTVPGGPPAVPRKWAGFSAGNVALTECPAAFAPRLDVFEPQVREIYAPFNVAITRSGATWRAHLAAGNRGVRVAFVLAAPGILDPSKRCGPGGGLSGG
jgi:hypothetical protein